MTYSKEQIDAALETWFDTDLRRAGALHERMAAALEAAGVPPVRDHWELCAKLEKAEERIAELEAQLAARAPVQPGDYSQEQVELACHAMPSRARVHFGPQDMRAALAAASAPVAPGPLQSSDGSEVQCGWCGRAVAIAAASVPAAVQPATVTDEDVRRVYLAAIDDFDDEPSTQRTRAALQELLDLRASVPAAPSDGRVLEWSGADYVKAAAAIRANGAKVGASNDAEAALDAVQPKLRAAYEAGWSEGRCDLLRQQEQQPSAAPVPPKRSAFADRIPRWEDDLGATNDVETLRAGFQARLVPKRSARELADELIANLDRWSWNEIGPLLDELVALAEKGCLNSPREVKP